MIMDGAGWHTDDVAHQFENVSIIKLPPYSPELNPIEQVWRWLRQRCLANQSFSNYDDIVDKIYAAWNQFWNQFLQCTHRLKQICSREWIDLSR
ncbi:transposase [Photobacterium sp. GJ3]|uniref:transposase n=1 Tax=Photobacterium sp. GJ3 TaxID=2829502 RepID=UPI001B8B5426|nr:transposase [Photobacterium sp. GJ3]QUJ67620.1 transposase [Photobacterium sp. GJ3]